MPLALKNVMALALKTFTCPWLFLTFSLVTHPVSWVGSHNCRSAWILQSVLGYPSHVRHLSPPGVSFLHGIGSWQTVGLPPLFPLGTLQIDYHGPWYPLVGEWAEYSPLWHIGTIWIGDAHGQSLSWLSTKSLHSAARSWEVRHLFLSERRQFLYDFGSQVLGGYPIPADGNAGW